MRERIVYQRDDVRKRMVEKREGWGEVMVRLGGIGREVSGDLSWGGGVGWGAGEANVWGGRFGR